MSDARKQRTSRRKATTRRREWKTVFLEAFRDTGMVTAACEAAGVSRSTVYDARQKDEAFALAWHDVEEETTEQMEREAFRRGVEGVERPVYQGGKLVGRVKDYSDTLLIFMLKARRPEKYRERHLHEHTGKVDLKAVTPERLRKMSDDELADLERDLADAA